MYRYFGLNLNWHPWVFAVMMVIAIIVLWASRRSYTTEHTGFRRATYVAWHGPSALGMLFFTAVLYLGVHWEMWSWYHFFLLLFWWVGLVCAVVGFFLARVRIAAHWLAKVAMYMVLAMLLVSWFGDLFRVNWKTGDVDYVGPYWSSFWWVLIAIAVVLLLAAFFWVTSSGLRAALAVAGIVLLLVAAFGYGWINTFAPNGDESANPSTGSSTSSSSSSETPKGEKSTKCQTWKMSTHTPKNGNWVTNGVREIRTADTKKEAAHAANVWLDKVKRNTATLSGAAAYFTNKTASRSALEKDGCATQRAVNLSQEISIALGMASVTPEMVPATARNSGTRGGHVFAYNVPGIGGDRHAIKVTLPNGKVIWIMARCGNVASHGKPPVGTGKPPKGTPQPPHHQVCQPPQYVPASQWDYSTCHKKPQSFNQMQNESPADQPVQENHNNVDTGSTPGTSGAPHNTQPHPNDPNPTHHGSNSGSSNGSGTPTGGGSDGSGGSTTSNDPVDTGQGDSGDTGSGTNTTDPGPPPAG